MLEGLQIKLDALPCLQKFLNIKIYTVHRGSGCLTLECNLCCALLHYTLFPILLGGILEWTGNMFSSFRKGQDLHP